MVLAVKGLEARAGLALYYHQGMQHEALCAVGDAQIKM